MATRTWRGNTYRFTVTSASATVGATYTNNGQTFTVTDTIALGLALYCTGTGSPSPASGTLTKASGIGDATITYSAFTTISTNFNVATNWLENAVPTTSDAVVFTTVSGNMTVNVASVCQTLNFTNFVNTITMTNSLSVSGAITLVLGMTITGTGNLIAVSTATHTSNGKSWTGNMTFGAGVIHTLGDNWTVTGTVTSGATLTTTINVNTLNISGGLSVPGNNILVGSTIINMNGTGTILSGTGSIDSTIDNEFIIDSLGGTITFNCGNGGAGAGRQPLRFRGTFRHLNGAVDCSTNTSTVSFGGATAQSITSNTIQWHNLNIGATSTITMTLFTDVIVNNTLTFGFTATITTMNGNTGTQKFIAKNNVNLGFGNSTVIGTAILSLEASGASQNVSMGTGNVNSRFRLAIVNNAGANTINLVGTIYWGLNTWTHTSGVLNGGTSVISINDTTATFNTSGALSPFFSITLISGCTITCNSLLYLTGTLTCSGSAIFVGSFGFNIDRLTTITITSIINFKSLITYTVRQLLTSTGASNAQFISYRSSTPGSKAILTLSPGALQDVEYTNPTDIDSSLGQTIYSFKGVITTTFNWNPLTLPSTRVYSTVY